MKFLFNSIHYLYNYCHDLAKQLSYYLYLLLLFFSFGTYYIERSVGKCHVIGVIGITVTWSYHMTSHMMSMGK